MAESYIEWADEVAAKSNVDSGIVIMKLTKELAKGRKVEEAKVIVAKAIINGGKIHEN